MKRVRLPHETQTEPGERTRQKETGRVAEDVQTALRLGAYVLQDQRNAYVLAALQGMGERKETRGGHAVTGVGVGAAREEADLTAGDAEQDRCQRADHEHGADVAGADIQVVE